MKKEVRETGLEDRIDRYLLGYMDEDERSAFESEMSSDSSLAEEVGTRRMVIASVREYGRMRDRLQSVEAGVRRERARRRKVCCGRLPGSMYIRADRCGKAELQGMRKLRHTCRRGAALPWRSGL